MREDWEYEDDDYGWPEEAEGAPDEHWRGRRYEARERGGDVGPPWDEFVQSRRHRRRGERGHPGVRDAGPPYGGGGQHRTWGRPGLERGPFMGPAGSYGPPTFRRGYDQMRHWRGPDWAERERSGPPSRDYRGVGPKRWRMSDERIRDEVCEWLTDHPLIDASDIDVEVEDGVVTLTGTVENLRVKRFASDLCEDLPFVKDIMNQLRLHERVVVGDQEAAPSNGGSERRDRSGARGKT